MGLKDLFGTLSGQRVNVNTAPVSTLALIPFIDEYVAEEIVSFRSEEPFASPAQLGAVVPPDAVRFLQQYVGVVSEVFEVTIEAKVGSRTRSYVAMLHRPPNVRNGTQIKLLYMYWR